MPTLQRVFLSWRQPAVAAVAERMRAWSQSEADVFRRSLVLAPTRESCRRLREQLGRLAGAILMPRVVPIGQLLAPASEKTAPAAVELAAWVETLGKLYGQLPVLFPRASSWHEENLLDVALHMQELVADLRLHGLEAADVASHVSDREGERWREVGLLLAAWRRRVAETGWIDSIEAAERERQAPTRLQGVRGKVILACVPGVPAPVRQVLLNAAVPVEVWVHAPEELAGTFDAWGVPTEDWLAERIHLEEEKIVVAENAAQLAELACDALVSSPGEGVDAALGLADASLVAPLAHALKDRGAGLFRPEGDPLAGTGWMTLLRLLADEAESPGYAAPLLGLARSTLVACGLGIEGGQHEIFCRELSAIEQQFFPETAASVRSLLADSSHSRARRTGIAEAEEGEENMQRMCASSWELLERWVHRSLTTGDALLAGLATWAERCWREAPADAPDGWREGAEFVLREVQALCTCPGLSPRVALGLLQARLSQARIVLRRAPEAFFDASGWMEMLFAPESHLVVAGMVEGCVPEAAHDDALLTERLRRELGMEHAGSKTARDSYLLRDLVESRHAGGSVHLLFARMSEQGDPLAPSSLLFRCRDEELPGRVLRLFGPPSCQMPVVARDLGAWSLEKRIEQVGDVTPETEVEAIWPGFVNPWKDGKKGFSPSSINAFWACPMRFWVGRAWRLRDEDPVMNKATFDLREVGNVLHDVLRNFARRFPVASAVRGVTDQELQTVMDDLLHAALGEAAERFYMPAAMQRRNMRRRLHAYARLHRQELLGGWECVLFEHAVGAAGETWSWDGFPMEFRLDRLDVLRDAAGNVCRVRVVDYKTGNPENIMLGGRPSPAAKCLSRGGDPVALQDWFPGLSLVPVGAGARTSLRRWADLQMPVYTAWAIEWARANCGLDHPEAVTPWYCFLPADPWKTCMVPWEDFHAARSEAVPKREEEQASAASGAGGASFMESGRLWAQAAMRAIAQGRGLVSAEQLGWEPPLYDRLEEVYGYAPDLSAWGQQEERGEGGGLS